MIFSSTYTWIFLVCCAVLSAVAKAKALWREKSPVVRRNFSRGLGFVWNSFNNVKTMGRVATSVANTVSMDNIRRSLRSSAFLTTVSSALNLAGYRVQKCAPMTFGGTYKISKQKGLDGLEGWMSLDAQAEEDVFERPPMIESPATSRKTFLPSTFDAYTTSISIKSEASVGSSSPPPSPSPSSPSSSSRSGSSTVPPTLSSPSLDLGGLWEWEDEEFTVCGPSSMSSSVPLAPATPAATATATQTIQDPNDPRRPADRPADLMRLCKFHNMLQSSPELTLGLCRLLEKAHWGTENAFERYDCNNGVKMSVVDGELVIGFRGTCTVWDLISDLRIGTERGPHGARVHKGFHRILKTIDRGGAFLREIREAVRVSGAKRVIFTGYSLGGAVASLALLEHGDALLAVGVDVRAITFGCPRFADNKDLQKMPRRLTTKIVHTYIEGDPIPLSLTSFVPWHRVDYGHVGSAVLIANKGKGVTVSEQGRKQSSDSSIKWWGIYTAPWSHHLTESYERYLQLQSIQLNFQLMMRRTPNFMSHLLKISATDVSAAADDLERFINEQGGVRGAVDRLRSAVEPLRAGSELGSFPAKISEELLGIALIEGFFRSLAVEKNGQQDRGSGVCNCVGRGEQAQDVSSLPFEAHASPVTATSEATSPESSESPAYTIGVPWQEPYIAAMLLATGQSSKEFATSSSAALILPDDATALDSDLETAAFVDKIQQMIFDASRDHGMLIYHDSGVTRDTARTSAETETPSSDDEYDLLLTYSVQAADVVLKDSSTAAGNSASLGKKRFPSGVNALRHRTPGSALDVLKTSIKV